MRMIRLLPYSLYWITTVLDTIRLNTILLFFNIKQNQPSQNLSSNSRKLTPKTSEQIKNKELDDDDQVVAIVGDQGFWIEDNKFLTAQVRDGLIDPTEAKEVDVFNLPPNKLGYMFLILDRINGE